MGGGGFGFGDLFDIPGMIVNAITSFLGMLIEQIMKPVREFLADTLLATPDVTQHADVRRLWTAMLGITAGIYVVFVTAGGITVMGYETFQTRYTLQQVAPRLLLGMIASATSLTVMGKAISLANALTHAIMATDTTAAGKGMVERVLPFALFGTAGLKIYLLILAILMIALVLAVLVGFLVRVAVMALLAAGAPLMLACHAHPLTDPVARLWWRALRLPGDPGRAVDDLHPRAEVVLRAWRHGARHPQVGPARHDARRACPVLGAVQDPRVDASGGPARYSGPPAARSGLGPGAQAPGSLPAHEPVRAWREYAATPPHRAKRRRRRWWYSWRPWPAPRWTAERRRAASRQPRQARRWGPTRRQPRWTAWWRSASRAGSGGWARAWSTRA